MQSKTPQSKLWWKINAALSKQIFWSSRFSDMIDQTICTLKLELCFLLYWLKQSRRMKIRIFLRSRKPWSSSLSSIRPYKTCIRPVRQRETWNILITRNLQSSLRKDKEWRSNINHEQNQNNIHHFLSIHGSVTENKSCLISHKNLWKWN